MIPDINSTRRGLEAGNSMNEVHHKVRKGWLLKRPDLKTPEDILLDMGVLVDRVEGAGNQEVFIGPHVNKDGEHEFQDVG